MLERVVGRMFRSATRSSQETRTEEKMGPSGSLGDDKAEPTQSPGDIEIDNSNHVLVKIATLYAERLMNDICLVVEGVEYPAHRLILCASSEVFQVMLMNPQWSESHLSRVELKETPACAAIFGQFLRYFYTGQIRINHLTIMPVLALADKYNVKDLITLCVDYMCGHIAHAATHNQLISWFQYTLSLGHYQVAQACQNFVKWNLEIVAETSDFGNFHHEILARLLQQNDLVVHNEMAVFRCVVRWLELQHEQLLQRCAAASQEAAAGRSGQETGVGAGMGCCSGSSSSSSQCSSEEEMESQVEAQMEALVEQVMSHVRFPMMSPRQLAELLMSPLTKKYKEFFIERMAIGMSFHSGHTDRIQQIACSGGGSDDECGGGAGGSNRLLFTPRLYTADKWSSLLTVENFGALQAYHTRTLVFSSHAGLAECNGERTCEWVVDVYPKGVWFRKYFLIVWQGTVEVPESVLRTVRLSITCKDPPETEDLRVKVGILINGIQDGVEHVMSVMQRNHRFSDKEKVLNLDNILAFDELNQVCSFASSSSPSPSTSSSSSSSNATSSSTSATKTEPSPYLVGPNRDILKIHIIIAPLCEFSSIEPPDQTLIIPTR